MVNSKELAQSGLQRYKETCGWSEDADGGKALLRNSAKYAV
jgi:hypothetical protein